MTRTEENINWLAERAERSVMGLSGHAWGIRSEIAQRVKELRAELVATQVSPPTELGVCECGHGEGLHKFNYKNEPKQYRYDCRGCACENYRPKMSTPTPMARVQGALRGEETDEQFNAAVNGIRAPAPTSRWAEDAETAQPVRTLELHRCRGCGTRWLLWPDAIHGGGWNLLDKWQRPGSCCDNVAMGDQIEHLRDFELVMSQPTTCGY